MTDVNLKFMTALTLGLFSS